MHWCDTAFWSRSHDTIGATMGQRAQLNYRALSLGAALLGVLVFAGNSAFSQGVAARHKPAPLLTDAPAGACNPDLDQPDIVDGTDVDGHPVAPATLSNGPIPFKVQIEVPLKTGRTGRMPAYVAVDGAKLDPLLNPQSSCK